MRWSYALYASQYVASYLHVHLLHQEEEGVHYDVRTYVVTRRSVQTTRSFRLEIRPEAMSILVNNEVTSCEYEVQASLLIVVI